MSLDAYEDGLKLIAEADRIQGNIQEGIAGCDQMLKQVRQAQKEHEKMFAHGAPQEVLNAARKKQDFNEAEKKLVAALKAEIQKNMAREGLSMEQFERGESAKKPRMKTAVRLMMRGQKI